MHHSDTGGEFIILVDGMSLLPNSQQGTVANNCKNDKSAVWNVLARNYHMGAGSTEAHGIDQSKMASTCISSELLLCF